MDKRALSAVPRPVLTDKNREILMQVSDVRYLVTADRKEIGGNDTLIINFFRAEGKDLKPEFRTFCQMDDYISQDLSTDKTKWKTGAINYLTGYLYPSLYSGNIVMSSAEEREEILTFFQNFRKKHGNDDRQKLIPYDECNINGEKIESRIDEYQDTIKGWRLQARHREEKAEIDRQMAEFGELPEDYGQFIKDTVFSADNYIFYSRQEGRAFCTKCGHDFELRKDGLYHREIAIWNDRDQIKHNRTVLCPYCNSYLRCKSEGMGRKKLFVVKWSVLVQKHGEDVLVRYFCHTKDFRDNFRNPEIQSSERFRTIHTAEKSITFEWGWFKRTMEVRWCYYKNRSYVYDTPSEMFIPRSAMLYNTNLLEAVSGTCMKYSSVDIYAHKILQDSRFLYDPWCISRYFNSYRERPYLEQLLKIGFYRLAESAMKDHVSLEFKNGRTILEILQVNKQQFNMLREIGNPSEIDVKILQYAGDISQGDFDILRNIMDDGWGEIYQKYLNMRKYTTIYKVDKYIKRKRIVHAMDYFDYIGWLEEMGYDMRNEFNIYPRHFVEKHDEMAKAYQKFKDRQNREEIKKFNRLLRQMRKELKEGNPLNLQTQGMFIRLPYQADELKREGEVLHHCVGTYIDRVMRGETAIFFVRRIESPDEPFYTLEWKNHKIAQCRGFHNCDMTPEVRAFVTLFGEQMKAYELKGEAVSA